jgi:hypothetical protein
MLSLRAQHKAPFPLAQPFTTGEAEEKSFLARFTGFALSALAKAAVSILPHVTEIKRKSPLKRAKTFLGTCSSASGKAQPALGADWLAGGLAARLFLIAVSAAWLALSCACALQRTEPELRAAVGRAAEQKNAPADLNVADDRWQQAATVALGNREGAVLVINPQTGRLLAVVNPRLAFSQAFPPGSTIKPFTALTALRAHLLERATARQCSGRYARGNYEVLCSHPKSTTPFNLPQALAYSCNDYFGHVGERISASAVNATLAGFGFGIRTGVNAGG